MFQVVFFRKALHCTNLGFFEADVCSIPPPHIGCAAILWQLPKYILLSIYFLSKVFLAHMSINFIKWCHWYCYGGKSPQQNSEVNKALSYFVIIIDSSWKVQKRCSGGMNCQQSEVLIDVAWKAQKAFKLYSLSR